MFRARVTCVCDHVVCGSPAPGALPQPLLFQLLVGLQGGAKAAREVAGRTGAPPTGKHSFSATQSTTALRRLLRSFAAIAMQSLNATYGGGVCLFVFQEQYQRDQERLEAEWRTAQQAMGESHSESGVIFQAFVSRVILKKDCIFKVTI